MSASIRITTEYRISFSHDYPKLHGQTSATLLAVIPIRIDKDTPRELLEYDTVYYVKDKTSLYAEKQYFPLPTGDYIQLVFIGNLRIPFCTIRKVWPPQKADYYKAAIGSEFAVHVKGREGGVKVKAHIIKAYRRETGAEEKERGDLCHED